MANDKSTYLRNAIINYVLLNDPAYDPAVPTVYVALFNGDPVGAGSEVSGGGYTRQHILFTSASSGQTENANEITFGVATSPGFGTVDYFALYDQSSGGNLLYSDSLNTAQTVITGNEAKFPAGSLTLAE